MDRGFGGNYGYRFSDIFPMGLRSAGRGVVRRNSTRSYKPRGTIRKPSGSPLARKPILNRARGRAMKKHRQAGYTAAKRKRTSAKKRGSFRKAKKIRTAPSKFAKRHYDDYGSVERDHCAYIGFQRHGCKERMWSIIGEALAKALLAKIKIYPRSYDEELELVKYDRLTLTYKRVSVPGGVEDEIDGVIVGSIGASCTFETLSTDLALNMKNRAEHQFSGDTQFAYYPIEAKWFNSSSDDRMIVKDIGEAVVELYATQVITVKNLTPNDGGTSDLDVVGVNPIHGKKYEFNNFRPKLIDSIEEQTQNGFLGAFYEVDDSNGINTAVSIPGVANSDNIIAHPPVPRQLFTNCARSTPVFMGAGGMKVERTTFKIKHKFSTLIERIYYNQYDKGSFGGCTFFAFERKTRSVNGESRVKISFDRALHMSAHCKLAVKKTMLKHYDANKVVGPDGQPIADP
jgi:hypothetical protein